MWTLDKSHYVFTGFEMESDLNLHFMPCLDGKKTKLHQHLTYSSWYHRYAMKGSRQLRFCGIQISIRKGQPHTPTVGIMFKLVDQDAAYRYQADL